MGWLSAPGYWLSRLVLTRALAAIYLVAFVRPADQFRALIGERGMLPVPRYLAGTAFRRSPSLFHVRYSDRVFAAACWAGRGPGGRRPGRCRRRGCRCGAGSAVWLVLWALYLSIVNVGQVWYRFGWETLLLETGFLAVFLGTGGRRPAPPRCSGCCAGCSSASSSAPG